MDLYTWQRGKLEPGALVTKRGGRSAINLGQAGRGRESQSIVLDVTNPPRVVDGRVYRAELCKLSPPRNGMVYVLEHAEPDDGDVVLVRINTEGSYTRNTAGYWCTVAGDPNEHVSGHGAHGGTGRLGSWSDAFVAMSPGDVVYVKQEGGHKTPGYALWFTDDGVLRTVKWQEYQAQQAARRAVCSAPENVMTGLASCFTFHRGLLQSGIQAVDTPAGPAVVLGQTGPRCRQALVPLVAAEAGMVQTAALCELELETPLSSDDERVYGLLASGFKEEGTFLVRVSTQWVYTGGSSGEVKAWRGKPLTVVSGKGPHWQEALCVLREGDAMFVRPEGGHKTRDYALWVEGGRLHCSQWSDYERAGCESDPGFWARQGCALAEHVPASWLGRVVNSAAGHGELMSLSPVTIDRNWDCRNGLTPKLVVNVEGGLIHLDQERTPFRHLTSEEQLNYFRSRWQSDNRFSGTPTGAFQFDSDEPTLAPIWEQVYAYGPDGEERIAYGTLAWRKEVSYSHLGAREYGVLGLQWFSSLEEAKVSRRHIMTRRFDEVSAAWHGARRRAAEAAAEDALRPRVEELVEHLSSCAQLLNEAGQYGYKAEVLKHVHGRKLTHEWIDAAEALINSIQPVLAEIEQEGVTEEPVPTGSEEDDAHIPTVTEPEEEDVSHIHDWACRVAKHLGHEKALGIIETELKASYGRVRRLNSLRVALGDLSYRLPDKRAEDLDRFLTVTVAYLEANLPKADSEAAAEETWQSPSDAASAVAALVARFNRR